MYSIDTKLNSTFFDLSFGSVVISKTVIHLVSVSNPRACESCIYTTTGAGETEIGGIYVNDPLLLPITKNKATMVTLMEQIANGFKSKDMGEVYYILGLKIS